MALAAQSPADGIALFEKSVQPVLKTNCIACHSEKALSSGLSLESREAILKGGNRGPAVDSSAPAASTLLKALRHDGDLKMPPGRKLKEEEIQAIEEWVAAGLPAPESFARSKRQDADLWSLHPPVRHALPEVQNSGWVRNPIDRFILARLEKANLQPSPEADRRMLLRRVHLDLTGLPPTPEQLSAFLSDQRPDAYERVVDELLGSPHYGERWGRHWLDLARYADTDGYTIDAPRDIWKYRDWVINAMNRDMPFDQFVIEQLAGDLLPNPTIEQLIATGFHRNTPSNYEGGIDFEQYRVEAVADRVATTGSVFLGLTVACARCHDHKFDPISQREFYQLFAFLNNVDEVDKEADRKFFNKPFLELGTEEEKTVFAAWEKEVYAIEGDIRKREDMLSGNAENDPELKSLRKKLNEHRRKRPPLVRTMVMRELPEPRVSYIHLGGDFTRKGVTVEPGTPAALPPLKAAGPKPNRLDLAKWLVDGRNPLTARVTVNRMWQEYFGKGIVPTESDFGTQGDKPSHLELLDWLALEFQDHGWSQKAIHRTIVTSATYRQASDARPDATAVDPDNRLLARQDRLRVDAEIIRDSALVAGGLISEEIGGPSVYPTIPAGANDVTQVRREWATSMGPDRYRRGLYTFFQRSAAHPALLVFDAPDATVSCTRRVRSNTPLQALISLNDELTIDSAEALAKRMIGQGAEDAPRIRYGWLAALAREPRAEEMDRMVRFVNARRDSQDDEIGVWTGAARVILNLDEFVTRP